MNTPTIDLPSGPSDILDANMASAIATRDAFFAENGSPEGGVPLILAGDPSTVLLPTITTRFGAEGPWEDDGHEMRDDGNRVCFCISANRYGMVLLEHEGFVSACIFDEFHGHLVSISNCGQDLRTLREVDDLKRSWSRDPHWDIETTEGFEAHREELLAYASERTAQWTREREEREADMATQLGCPDNLELARHVLKLEDEIRNLSMRLAAVEER